MIHSKKSVTKLVIPLAGLGTRFLPSSSAYPKEMAYLVDRPVLQYVVEEAYHSGIKEVIFVLNTQKDIIAKYFSRRYQKLYQQKILSNIVSPDDSLMKLNQLVRKIKFYYIKKPATFGDGHSILLARSRIGRDEPFAVTMGDLLSPVQKPFLKQLINIYYSKNCPVVSVEKVRSEATSNFGVIATKNFSSRFHLVDDIVEKPKSSLAPSNLALTGKYILRPDIFPYLQNLLRNYKTGEIKLAEALKRYCKENDLLACECRGKIQDAGNKLDFLKTTVFFGIHHRKFGKPLKKFIRSLSV